MPHGPRNGQLEIKPLTERPLINVDTVKGGLQHRRVWHRWTCKPKFFELPILRAVWQGFPKKKKKKEPLGHKKEIQDWVRNVLYGMYVEICSTSAPSHSLSVHIMNALEWRMKPNYRSLYCVIQVTVYIGLVTWVMSVQNTGILPHVYGLDYSFTFAEAPAWVRTMMHSVTDMTQTRRVLTDSWHRGANAQSLCYDSVVESNVSREGNNSWLPVTAAGETRMTTRWLSGQLFQVEVDLKPFHVSHLRGWGSPTTWSQEFAPPPIWHVWLQA